MNANSARIALLLVLCTSGLGSAQTTTKEASQYPSPIDVYEAVLHYQIKAWELVANSYCVKVNGKDAPTALLERFRPLPVKVASACRKQTSQSVLMRVVDRSTGKQSVIFDIGEIRWPKQLEAEV